MFSWLGRPAIARQLSWLCHDNWFRATCKCGSRSQAGVLSL